MNSKTKIVVIHMKELVLGAVIFVAALIAAIALIMSLFQKNDSTVPNTDITPKSTNTAHMAADSEKNSIDNTSLNHTNTSVVTNTTTNSTVTYTPGVYTASVSLEGNPVDIQVTVDKHNINSIELVHISDAVTTMYPLIQTNFNEIANLVIQSGSTHNITFNSDNKYTSDMLLNAIQKALDKCIEN